jgi:hypothetical protein
VDQEAVRIAGDRRAEIGGRVSGPTAGHRHAVGVVDAVGEWQAGRVESGAEDDRVDRMLDARAVDDAALVRLADAVGVDDSDPDALAPAIWALAHGLAFLYLDGRLEPADPAAVEVRVSGAVAAVLGASSS